MQVISTVVVSRLKAGLYKRLIMRMKADLKSANHNRFYSFGGSTFSRTFYIYCDDL